MAGDRGYRLPKPKKQLLTLKDRKTAIRQFLNLHGSQSAKQLFEYFKDMLADDLVAAMDALEKDGDIVPIPDGDEILWSINPLKKS